MVKKVVILLWANDNSNLATHLTQMVVVYVEMVLAWLDF